MRKINQITERVYTHLTLLLDGKTVRQISKITHWSKTVVYEDLTTRAKILYPNYTERIKKILANNYNMRGVYGVHSRNLRYKDTEKLTNYLKIFMKL